MIAALVLAVAAVADPGLPPYRAPAGRLTGELTVAAGPFLAPWAAGFMRANPGVTVTVAKPSASSMVDEEALFGGRMDIAPGNFKRELAYQRAAGLGPAGPDPFVVAVSSGGTAFHPDRPEASPALAIYVNAANPLSRLTLAQLDAVFSRTRRRGYPVEIKTWGQLGLSGEWTEKPIHRYGMVLHNQYGYPHGYVYFLMERMLGGGEFKQDMVQVPDTAFGSGANQAFAVVVGDVAGDRGGIAFAPFDFAAPGAKTLALAEKEGAPYLRGTREEVLRRTYPLTMTSYLSARGPPGRKLEPLVREFFLYVLSRDGQQVIADRPGHLLPLPAAFAAAERAKLGP